MMSSSSLFSVKPQSQGYVPNSVIVGHSVPQSTSHGSSLQTSITIPSQNPSGVRAPQVSSVISSSYLKPLTSGMTAPPQNSYSNADTYRSLSMGPMALPRNTVKPQITFHSPGTCSTSSNFVFEDDVISPTSNTSNYSQPSPSATVGQLLDITRPTEPFRRKTGVLVFNKKQVWKDICGDLKDVNVDLASQFCTGKYNQEITGEYDEYSSDDEQDDEEDDDQNVDYGDNRYFELEDSDESDETVTSQFTTSKIVPQASWINPSQIPTIKMGAQSDIVSLEEGESQEEYNERKRLYSLILKTQYAGNSYIYSKAMAWRSRPGTHYPADVINTLDIVERAIEKLTNDSSTPAPVALSVSVESPAPVPPSVSIESPTSVPPPASTISAENEKPE